MNSNNSDNQSSSLSSPTVLEVSNVPNLRPLYRFCLVGMAITAFACLLFVVLLVGNYWIPYRVAGWEKKIEHRNETGEVAHLEVSATESTGFVLDGEGATKAGESDSSVIPAEQSRWSTPFLILPTEAALYLDRRERLLADPGNIALQQEVRAIDVLLRNQYFVRRARARTGSLMLLVSATLLIFFGATAATVNRKLPQPSAKDQCPAMSESSQRKRRMIALGMLFLLGTACIGMTLGLLLGGRSELEPFLLAKAEEIKRTPRPTVAELKRTSSSEPPSTLAGHGADSGTSLPIRTSEHTTKAPLVELTVESKSEPAPDPADQEAFLLAWNANWPVFRGPYEAGILSESNSSQEGDSQKTTEYPDSWDFQSGENIVWKTNLSLPGHNSPVIWGNNIFLTGADEHARKVSCYHVQTGQLVWETVIPVSPEGSGELDLNPDTGYAASTVVTDGSRVYAIFPNGDLVALDYQGKILWTKGFGIPPSHYGYSSSLTLWFDRVIVQFDIDQDEKDGIPSRLLAVRGTNGDILWETIRKDARGSWASPSVRLVGDVWQILVMGDPYLAAYHPEDGTELWRYTGFETDVAPSPIASGSTVYAVNATPCFAAIDGTARGELAKTPHTLWTAKCGGLPNACCPLPVPGLVILLAENGAITGLDIATKKIAWELFVDEADSFYSSPVYTGQYIYLFAKTEEDSHAYIVDPAKLLPGEVDKDALDLIEIEGALVKKISLPEPVCATPALHQGCLIVRSEKSLWCLGKQ